MRCTGSECSMPRVTVDDPPDRLYASVEPPSGTTSMSSSRAAAMICLALVAAGLVVALDRERADRLEPPQVRERVVERVDLGLVLALARRRGSSRSRTCAARGSGPARAISLAAKIEFVSCDGSWIVVTPNARLA
jgi:hypothetical protein